MKIAVRGTFTSLFIFLILLLALPVYAKSMYFKNSKVRATVNSNGSVKVKESRTFGNHGDFNWMTLRMSKAGISGITDVSVSENGEKFKQSYSAQPKTYKVQDISGSLYISFFYDKKDGDRTFDIGYTIKEAVRAYRDTAELQWELVGAQDNAPSDSLQITINLPKGANKNDIKAFGQGALHELAKIDNGSTITFTKEYMRQTANAEVRLLFPTKLVKNVKVLNELRLKKAIEEERILASSADKKMLLENSIIAANIGLPFLALIIAFLIFLRFGKEHKPNFSEKYYRMLPGNDPPAIVGYLVNKGRVSNLDFTATVLDLARRGYIHIKEESDGGKNRSTFAIKNIRTADNSLAVYEAKVLSILFSMVAKGNRLTLEQLKEYSKSHAAFRHEFSDWQRMVRFEGGKRGHIEKASIRAQRVNNIIGWPVLILNALLFFFHQSLVIAVLGALPLIGVFIMSGMITRRSQQAVNENARWKSLRRYLRDFSNLKECPSKSVVLWEYFVVYAVVLGVAKNTFRQLASVIENDSAFNNFANDWYTNYSLRRSNSESESLSSGMGQFVTSAISSLSSLL